MEQDGYEILASDEPLPEKYLSVSSSRRPSDVGDVDDVKASTSGDGSDVGSVDVEGVASRSRLARIGDWGSAESGLNRLGRSVTSVGYAYRARSFDRRSDEEEEERQASGVQSSSRAEPRRPSDDLPPFSEQTRRRPPRRPAWLAVNTENVLAKVRELLGSQSTRDRMTGVADGQKASKRHGLFAKRSEPLKAHRISPSVDNAPPPSPPAASPPPAPPADMELENRVLFNLRVKNGQNVPEPEKKNALNLDQFQESRVESEESPWKKGLSGLTFGSSRTQDTVPTAHVTPNLLNHHSTSNLHKYPSDGSLHMQQASSASHQNRLFVASNDSHHRSGGLSSVWTSQPNVIGDHGPEDFQPLPLESDLSILQNSSYNSDINAYKHRGIGVGLPMRQMHHDQAGVPMSRLVESTRHSSQSLMLGSQQARDYPLSYPYEGQKEMFTAATVDRAYPYSHGISTSGCNAQNYSQEHSSQFVGSNPTSQFINDFSSWEQKHQESLRRQQMEISEQPYNVVGPQSVSSFLVGDPHKLDSIKRAADNIIKEKDMIIERQKMKIMELERGYKEPDALSLRLQDFEHENLSLKRQLAEKGSSSTRSYQNSLEDKLGAAEHEVQYLTMLLKEETDNKKEDLAKVFEQLKDKDELIMEWKEKYSKLKNSHDALQKKMDGMERYFEDLPTVEESSKKDKLVKSLQEENVKCQQQISELEKKLSDARKGLSSRDALIKSLEENVTDMEKRIEKLEARNKKLKEQMNKDGIGFDDIEDLQFENKKLKTDLEKAKKLLEVAQKKSQQLETRYKAEICELKERLSQEESAVVALREEMLSKEQHLKKLRQSFKEISNQNQDLIDTNMALKDRIREADRQTARDVQKLERRLMKEMSICFTELSNLVQICVQRAEGKDPNLSVLLGVKEEPDMDLDSAESLQSLKGKISKMRELRDEVGKLQALLSNKCAEEMCEDVNSCSTQ